MTIWAQRILTLKNQLTTPDAKVVETAFAAKLDALVSKHAATLDTPEASTRAETNGNSKAAIADGNTSFDREPNPASEKPKLGRMDKYFFIGATLALTVYAQVMMKWRALALAPAAPGAGGARNARNTLARPARA